ICLESEEVVVAERPLAVRSGPTFRFESRLPAAEMEFTFSTDHRLTVRSHQPRRRVCKYVVDLRFVDPGAIVGRRIAWRWWQGAAVLAVLAALSQWLPAQLGDAHWQQATWPAAVALAVAAAGLGLVGLLRTRHVVELRSVHGGAPLAGIAGRLGGPRADGSFAAELAQRVDAALAQSAQTKQQFLRDEMREHHRLWSEGVLSDAIYEASKLRILRAHDEGRAPG
ncbi:MAG: hypothetical protein K0R70_1501, partial [Steroidobacteraceae bacterium]|nr:hypothetical protein [Steroidobacteraceae bacterium]